MKIGRYFEERGVKSVIFALLEAEEKLKAYLAIESIEYYRKWTEEDKKFLDVFSSLLSDGLEKLAAEKDIQHMAYYDSLTGLANRFLFKERVEKSIESLEKAEDTINIVFIDLDNFKSVNDTIGHDGGDYLLGEIARSLKESLRESDTVARFAGDEFIIMLDNREDQKHIAKILDKIMNIFSQPFNIYGQDFSVTASAGISVYPDDGREPESLIKHADTAMYEAKSQGKNTYTFCTTSMKEEIEMNMIISNDLYQALEREEFSLYYQPQMDLEKKEIEGLEALIRWKHPKFGMIAPNIFIPIAEKNGLINAIGHWVLKTACLQNKKWQDMGLKKLKMAVNLSSIEFINSNIARQVEEVLKEVGLDPKYLELEITESIAIKETDFIVEVLNKLKKLGVSIAIDDFGTEYSSLSRLKLLPIDRIKIDMEFIHGIESNEKDKAITIIIINLAKSLGLNVLAEGVETSAQLEFLNQKMCDYVQGFY